jgi:sec-independent protein translocase protein TatB
VFGIGGSEILVILVIALLFLGPDKLPEAAKTISKTVRDLKKQGRILQQTIENDEHIGGAIRDLKSALRGDEIVTRPPPKKLPDATIGKPEDLAKAADRATLETSGTPDTGQAATSGASGTPDTSQVATSGTPDTSQAATSGASGTPDTSQAATSGASGTPDTGATAAATAKAEPAVTLPPSAGEADPDVPDHESDREELAKLIKPAAGVVARETEAERKHG